LESRIRFAQRAIVVEHEASKARPIYFLDALLAKFPKFIDLRRCFETARHLFAPDSIIRDVRATRLAPSGRREVVELSAELRDAWLARINLAHLTGCGGEMEAYDQAGKGLLVARTSKIDAGLRYAFGNELKGPGRKRFLVVANQSEDSSLVGSFGEPVMTAVTEISKVACTLPSAASTKRDSMSAAAGPSEGEQRTLVVSGLTAGRVCATSSSSDTLNRLEVLARLDSDRLTAQAAAELMAISLRQTYRLLRRYRDGGASAIARPSLEQPLAGCGS
jgi:hypothetical protein